MLTLFVSGSVNKVLPERSVQLASYRILVYQYLQFVYAVKLKYLHHLYPRYE
jgi:hypothetical protein